jgi:hypothetical protein
MHLSGRLPVIPFRKKGREMRDWIPGVLAFGKGEKVVVPNPLAYVRR